MDISAVVIALVAALASFGGSYLANNKNQAVMQEQIIRLREDVAKLSDRVDKHNGVTERMSIVEYKLDKSVNDINNCYAKLRETKK